MLNITYILALLVIFTAFSSKYIKSDLLKFIIICLNIILAVSILHPRFLELIFTLLMVIPVILIIVVMIVVVIVYFLFRRRAGWQDASRIL